MIGGTLKFATTWNPITAMIFALNQKHCLWYNNVELKRTIASYV